MSGADWRVATTTAVVLSLTAYIFPVVINFTIDVYCAWATLVPSSTCSKTTKHFRYKCHGLFGNSPVVITVKSCVTYVVHYNKILRLFKPLSRIMAHYSHVIYACYQNMPENLFASCSFATNNFAKRLYTS